MAKYNHKKNYHANLKRAKRANWGIYLVVMFFALVFVAAGVFLWQQSKVKDDVAVSATKAVSYYNANIRKTYNNEVFRFESGDDWQFSAADSSLGNHYVYYVSKEGLVTYQFDVYLNGGMQREAVTQMLATKVIGGKIVVQATSPRCDTPERRKEAKTSTIPMTFNEVSYICHVTNSKAIAATGLMGGSYDIPMYTSRGALRTVNLKFTDHTGKYYTDEFKKIVESFILN